MDLVVWRSQSLQDLLRSEPSERRTDSHKNDDTYFRQILSFVAISILSKFKPGGLYEHDLSRALLDPSEADRYLIDFNLLDGRKLSPDCLLSRPSLRSSRIRSLHTPHLGQHISCTVVDRSDGA